MPGRDYCLVPAVCLYTAGKEPLRVTMNFTGPFKVCHPNNVVVQSSTVHDANFTFTVPGGWLCTVRYDAAKHSFVAKQECGDTIEHTEHRNALQISQCHGCFQRYYMDAGPAHCYWQTMTLFLRYVNLPLIIGAVWNEHDHSTTPMSATANATGTIRAWCSGASNARFVPLWR